MLKYLTLTACTAVFCCLPVSDTLAAAQPNTAHVRVLHATSSTGELALTINGQRTVLEAITYSTLTGWHQLEPGAHVFMFSEANTETTISLNLTVDANDWVTVSVIGTAARDTLTAHAIREDYSEVAPGEARLSMFHALDGAPPVDLISGDAALFQYITYPNGQDGFVTVDLIAAEYPAIVNANPSPQQALLDLGTISLRPGENTFLALIGTVDNPTFVLHSEGMQTAHQTRYTSLLAQPPADPPRGFVRLGHFASGAPNVDLIINGENSAVLDLAFASISPFVELPPGPQQISINHGEVQLVPTFTVEVIPDRWLMIAVIGAVENGTLHTQIFEENMATLPENQTRIGVFQAIPGIPPVDVQTADGTPLIRLLGHPGSQGNNDGYEAVEISAGTTDIDIISASDDEAIIVDLPEITFEANHTYLITTLRADPPYIIEETALEATDD